MTTNIERCSEAIVKVIEISRFHRSHKLYSKQIVPHEIIYCSTILHKHLFLTIFFMLMPNYLTIVSFCNLNLSLSFVINYASLHRSTTVSCDAVILKIIDWAYIWTPPWIFPQEYISLTVFMLTSFLVSSWFAFSTRSFTSDRNYGSYLMVA